MPWLTWVYSLAFLLAAQAISGATALSYSPPAVPLVTRSPFLSSYHGGGPNEGSGTISRSWAFNGNDGHVTAWTGLARIDGVGYSFLGDAIVNGQFVGIQGDVKSVTITPTQTQYIVRCGTVDLNVTFLSPIEPNDFMRMSLPFSYMSVVAAPNDGQRHEVQIYSDLSGEWLSDDSNSGMSWSTQKSGGIVYHQFTLSSPVQFGQSNGRVQYGNAYHAVLYDNSITYQTSSDVNLRSWFNLTGSLNNTQDTSYRAINLDWPCFALAKDLGNITSATSPTVFAMGLSRDPAISYQTSSGSQSRSLFYKTQFGNDPDALSFFLNDFNNSLASAAQFDNKLTSAASQISDTYTELVTFAARQTFSHVEITVSQGSDGNLNSSDTLAFMGLDSVNKIENIYASAPFWIWANPSLLRLLIEPIIQWHRRTAGTGSALNYVIGDIGDTYPQATGPSSALTNPKSLESTADMILITAALVKASGDSSILTNNLDLYGTWADYLKNNAQNPGTQTTTDGAVTGNPVNNSNLAAKAIIALKAYADMLSSVGRNGGTYHDAATSYASSWQTQTQATAGIASGYGDVNSWTMAYNLFTDKWLQTSLFPDSVYQGISSFYGQHQNVFGLPLSDNSSYTSPNWMGFAAGLASDTSTRDAIVSKLQYYLKNGPDQRPWPNLYGVINGSAPANSFNTPNVGGVYSLLVRDMSTGTSSSHSGASSTVPHLFMSSCLTLILVAVLSLWGL